MSSNSITVEASSKESGYLKKAKAKTRYAEAPDDEDGHHSTFELTGQQDSSEPS